MRRPREGTRIYFWTPLSVPDGLDVWHPDNEPFLFADGRGHAFYELYARMRLAGLAVSIGRNVPDDADVVIVFAKDLSMRNSLSFVVSAAHVPCLLIESDWPPSFMIPVDAAVIVRSNTNSVTSSTEIAIPLLPQRGLIPRGTDRRGFVRTVGYKGDPNQAPSFLRTQHFTEKLDQMGLTFNYADLGDARARWHDFSDTDVVLCMRSVELPTSHKPPTKLINAWAAHCIPLTGPEPAYLELVTDRQTGLIVRDEATVVNALRELQASPALRRTLEDGIAQKARKFNRDQILGEWIEAAARAAESGRRPRARAFWVGMLVWVRAQVVNLHYRGRRRLCIRGQR